MRRNKRGPPDESREEGGAVQHTVAMDGWMDRSGWQFTVDLIGNAVISSEHLQYHHTSLREPAKTLSPRSLYLLLALASLSRRHRSPSHSTFTHALLPASSGTSSPHSHIPRGIVRRTKFPDAILRRPVSLPSPGTGHYYPALDSAYVPLFPSSNPPRRVTHHEGSQRLSSIS